MKSIFNLSSSIIKLIFFYFEIKINDPFVSIVIFFLIKNRGILKNEIKYMTDLFLFCINNFKPDL
jgi:hypothetical protein